MSFFIYRYRSLHETLDCAPQWVVHPCDLLQEPLSKPVTLPLASERLSQLLFGEPIRVVSEQGEWLEVEVLAQPKWNGESNSFEPYRGWIPSYCAQSKESSSYLLVTSSEAVVRAEPSFDSKIIIQPTMGSFISACDQHQGWHRIVIGQVWGWIYDKDVASLDWAQDCSENVWRWQWKETTGRLLGLPYVWGGLAVQDNHHGPLGIDCSGLIHISARRLGMLIARDAKDQYRWLKMSQVATPSLEKMQAADLLFTSKSGPSSIDHVMMYLGNQEWIDSSTQKGGTRKSITSERFGKITCQDGGYYSSVFGKEIFISGCPMQQPNDQGEIECND